MRSSGSVLLPYPYHQLAESGGLIAYSPDLTDWLSTSRSRLPRFSVATQARRHPNPNKPIEFELVINLKTAKGTEAAANAEHRGRFGNARRSSAIHRDALAVGTAIRRPRGAAKKSLRIRPSRGKPTPADIEGAAVLQKLLVGAAALVVVLLIAALAAPLLIPADVYKARLAGIVKERTGRDLRIDGPLRFSILPRIGLVAGRVSLSSPPGGFTAELLQTETLTGGIKLAPLLHGTVEIDQLSLDHPRIAFEIDKEGRRNWVFHPTPKPPSTPAAPATSSGGLMLTASAATISGGTASYLDQRSGKSYTASDIDMMLSMPSSAGPIHINGAAVWNGEKIALDGTVASFGSLRNGGASAAGLKLSSALLKLSFEGELSGGRPHRASGNADLSTPSARQLLAWLELQHVPAGGGLGPLSVKGRIEAAGPQLSLTDAEIALDNASARGALVLDRTRRPAVNGDLEVSNLDLTPFLSRRGAASSDAGAPAAPAGSDARPNTGTERSAASSPPTATSPSSPQPAGAAAPAPASSPAATPSGWSEARFDLAPLKRLDAALKLRINALRWGEVNLDKATLDLRLIGGRLRVDAPEVSLYGGTGAGMVTVDAGSALPALAAHADLHGVAVQPLFRDLAGADQLSGAGDIGLVLEGKGASPHELVGSLTGNVSLNVAKGALGSPGFAELMQGIAGPLAGRKNLPKALDFDTLTASGAIADGVLRTTDLKLASPKMSVTGEGMVDLKRRQLEYLADLKNGEIVRARIAITGPWDDPSYKAQSVTIAPGAVPKRGKLRDLLKQLR
jgi:AsmA protein